MPDSQKIIVDCFNCGKFITEFPEKGIAEEEEELLLRQGFVPVPNAGWLCSQACGDAFEKASNVRFQRDENGNINYYPAIKR